MTTVDPATRKRELDPELFLPSGAYVSTPEQLRLAAACVARWASARKDPEGAVVVAAVLGLTP